MVEVGQVALVDHHLGRAVLGRPIGGQRECVHLQAVGDQPLGEIAPVLTAYPGDEGSRHHPAFWAATSASTIMATSSSKLTFGSQPSTRRALDASPISWSTSAGRMKRSS